MTLILRVDPMGSNGAKPSGYVDVWPADDTITGTGFLVQQIISLHFTTADVVAYQDVTLDASDAAGLTTTPLRYYVRERLDNIARPPGPNPYVIQVLTANGSPQRLSDLRALALAAPTIALTPGYIQTITSTDTSVTLTRTGATVDLSVSGGTSTIAGATDYDNSTPATSGQAIVHNGTKFAPHTLTAADVGAATAAALTAEASTRAANDTAEATARASADSTHAALTTTAHGGIVASTDARLTDARTPTTHHTTHNTGGTDPIAPGDIGAATASALTTHTALTTTAHGGIVADTDSRLTNARTPTAHASTHAAAGSDPVTITLTSQVAGVLPVANGGNGFTNKSSFVEAGFVADGSVYARIPYAMTLASPTAVPGVATGTYAIATAATPTVFSTCSFPQAFAAGDVIRVTAAGVSTYETFTFTRTA